MKCAVHNNREAVGLCKECGAAVCTECRSVVAGYTYCDACIESGRYRPPRGVAVPRDDTPVESFGFLGSPPRAFTIGAFGIFMLGIVFHFTWIADYTAMLSPVYYPYGMNPINPIKTVVYALIGTSITLVGGTFYHYRGSYGSRMSLAAGICSYIFAWWLLIADLLQYTGLVWVQQTDPYIFYSYWVPGPLGIHYTVLQLIANALLAVTFVLWASAMVVTRHYTRQSSVAIAAAVLFLIPAHIILLTLPYSIVALITSFGYSYGYIYIYSFMSIFSPFLSALIEPACILGAILFYRSRNIWKLH